MRRLELTGQRFHLLTVVQRSATKPNQWDCRCDCGTEWTVHGPSLVSGNTGSCGCWGRSILGKNTKTHGRRHTPEYESWASMIQRCTNPNNPSYPRWGGRGITVCRRWRQSFAAFDADMGPRPSLKHSIDRVDNHGNYTPKNCRWATPHEQSRNTSRNLILVLHGRAQILSDWARELNIGQSTLWRRLNIHGWSVERTLTTPV